MSIDINRLRKLVWQVLISPMRGEEYKLLNNYLTERFNRWLANRKYSGARIQITIEDIHWFVHLPNIDKYETELLKIVNTSKLKKKTKIFDRKPYTYIRFCKMFEENDPTINDVDRIKFCFNDFQYHNEYEIAFIAREYVKNEMFLQKLDEFNHRIREEIKKIDDRMIRNIKSHVENKDKLKEKALTQAAFRDAFTNFDSPYKDIKTKYVGSKTVDEWYNEYKFWRTNALYEHDLIKKSTQKKYTYKPTDPTAKRVATRPDATGVEMAYPFKSKIKQYKRQNPTVDIVYNDIPVIKRLPEKELQRPYFSNERGGWEIDFAFNICNDSEKNKDEKNVSDTWLFCININTRFLEVYHCKRKDADSVFLSLKDLINHHTVSSIRGDGEKAFTSETVNSLTQSRHIKVFWNDGKFTNHNRIVDCVIKTIRNAIGYRTISPAQLQKIVNYYNNTVHKGIGCTPMEMENSPEIEYQYIRWCENKLNDVLSMQSKFGLTKYEKGNILLVHLDKNKTSNKFEKRRTYYDRVGEFVEYENGNVKINLFTPVVIGTNSVKTVVVPVYHTQFLAKNKDSIPEEYIKSYIINMSG